MGVARPPQLVAAARLPRQQRLPGEAAQPHSEQDRGADRHRRREPPEQLAPADQDQAGLDLEDDRHRQDDERGHHVGGSHRPRVRAHDHRPGDHRRDLADRRDGERDEDAEREVAKARKGDPAVDEEGAEAEDERDAEHGGDLAGVDLGLPQRGREEHLQGRPLALADERLEGQHERVAGRQEDDEEGSHDGEPLDHHRGAPAEVGEGADPGAGDDRDHRRQADHGKRKPEVPRRIAEVPLGDEKGLTPVELHPLPGSPRWRGRPLPGSAARRPRGVSSTRRRGSAREGPRMPGVAPAP